MSTKENAAVSQLLALLEARYALRVLWALRDGHAQTFRLLQDSVGGITPNTLNTRIKELREAGIVNHGSDGYSLKFIIRHSHKHNRGHEHFSIGYQCPRHHPIPIGRFFLSDKFNKWFLLLSGNKRDDAK